ncbi:transposase [Streptomyces sp. ME01-24h]|nr:transposase [Streptomyces sp. ME01-24h]
MTYLIRWTHLMCMIDAGHDPEGASVCGGVYDLGLHIVWCPKHRHPVLGGTIAARLDEPIQQKANERGWEVVALEIMPDHHGAPRPRAGHDRHRWSGRRLPPRA